MNYSVYSLAWNNIDKEILALQKEIFNFFKIPIKQCIEHGIPHGQWMQGIVESTEFDEIIVFVDIDAIPLSRLAFDEALDSANRGEIFGLAQVANHLKYKNQIYAGPMFIAFKKSVWDSLARPSLVATECFDAAQSLSVEAIKHKVPLRLVYPTTCLDPKWALSSVGLFGIGTFYSNKFFHLFESRISNNKNIFISVCRDVLNGNALDFNKYLKVYHESKQRHSKVDFIRGKIKRYLSV